MSSEPKKLLPDSKWKHFDLYQRVRDIIFSLPGHFSTTTHIEGISATDIFTLNSALGATIENQVVDTLNRVRSVWDPSGKYRLYSFVRQAQTFPDVLLTKKISESENQVQDEIILGIELKGWYLLAKEGEPSFRFQVTPSACAIADLVVVVPWTLSNVISGSPRIFTPYIESARYAAEYRNYWWQSLRDAKTDSDILCPDNVCPYPTKSDRISDTPKSDQGGNFGRFSRSGIMDDYIKGINTQLICGIRAGHWRDFFKLFHEQADLEKIRTKIEQLRKKFADNLSIRDTEQFFERLLSLMEEFGLDIQ
ncbi:MAG: hypothetical protein FWC50_04260 [Planctomycetaceae bacterium]|nr:hypothetical protein [Planctomycetaceae bacterium]